MVAFYPLGPITDGMGLNITVMSYMGDMYFGLLADRDAVADVWELAHALPEALAELKKAASAEA